MRTRKKSLLAFMAVLFSLLPAGAFGFSLEGRVKEYTLENGMKVLMLERRDSPTLSF